jgi:hypothetical protein
MRTMLWVRIALGLMLPALAAASAVAATATAGTLTERLRVIEQVVQAGPFKPDWPSLGHYAVPDWYRDAKFGIFIHSGTCRC